MQNHPIPTLHETELVPTPWDTVNDAAPGSRNLPPSPANALLPPLPYPGEGRGEGQLPPLPPGEGRGEGVRATSTAAWTIPLICIGIAVIACCLLIPAADENRRLAYESLQLKADLAQLQKQSQTNEQFLHRVQGDPTLAERLAQRQMKMVREGTSILQLKTHKISTNSSPFLLVTLPPPKPLPPYQPTGGTLANLCRQPHSQLYLIGGALLMIATGLVLSHN